MLHAQQKPLKVWITTSEISLEAADMLDQSTNKLGQHKNRPLHTALACHSCVDWLVKTP